MIDSTRLYLSKYISLVFKVATDTNFNIKKGLSYSYNK